VFEIKYENVHDAISYILYPRTRDVKFSAKIRFYGLRSDLRFLLLFSFECGVFPYDSSMSLAYTDQLAGHMAVFKSSPPCGMCKRRLAAGFQLSPELWHLTDVTLELQEQL